MNMNELFDVLKYVATAAAVIWGNWLVVKYRVGKLEQEQTKDREDVIRLAAEVREDARKTTEAIWAGVHKLEAEHRAHKDESYENRLKIAERFTDVLTAQSDIKGQITNIATGISYMKDSLVNIAKDIREKKT